MKIVSVKWQDSNVMHGWRPKSEVENDDVAYCTTVGFIVYEDKTKVVIAFSESDCESVLECITIPKGCITEIKEMRTK